MSVRVLSGALAPEALKATILAGTSGVDLSEVTAACFTIKRPDGSVVTWPATTSAASVGTITLTHAFAVGETDQLGTHSPIANLTIPTGVVRAKCTSFSVVDPFA